MTHQPRRRSEFAKDGQCFGTRGRFCIAHHFATLVGQRGPAAEGGGGVPKHGWVPLKNVPPGLPRPAKSESHPQVLRRPLAGPCVQIAAGRRDGRVSECLLHETDRRAVIEGVAGVSMPEEVGRHRF